MFFFKKKDEEIKKDYKNYDGLNLKWFSAKFNYLFNNLVNQEGLSTIPLEIIDKIELEIPLLKEQIEELKVYEKIINLKEKIELILEKIDKIKQKHLEINYPSGEEVELSYLIKHISRNDSLSEEGIYKRSENLKFSKEKIVVLSGSFDEIYGIAPLDEDLHFIKDKMALQVITRGQAGKIRFLKKGNYATNTNSMLLIIKEDKYKELGINSEEDKEIYLKFLEYYLEPLFLKSISSADLGVLRLTEILDEISMPKIKINDYLKRVVSDYDKLNNLYLNLDEKLNRINKILQKKIIFK